MIRRLVRVDCKIRAEKGKTGVALPEYANSREMTECFGKFKRAAMLRDNQAAWREKLSGAEK